MVKVIDLLSKAADLTISSISSLEGGSATAGTGLAAPLGNQDIDDIIFFCNFGICNNKNTMESSSGI